MASARAREDLTSQNYSIEDKNMRDMDDKYANRREDRYNGPTSKFSEKEGELKFSRINPIRNSILSEYAGNVGLRRPSVKLSLYI